MPCRKKCCGKHGTPRHPSSQAGHSCTHSYNPRAVIASSSGCCLPSVPTPCDRHHAPCSGSNTPYSRPGTPCSICSRTNQEYCTSETCRNSGNCYEDPPQYCTYGKREVSDAVGSCSGLCRAQERTTGTQWKSSDVAPRSLLGACPTVSATTSPVNLPPAPCTQRHEMPSCDTTQRGKPSTQNASKCIIRQQCQHAEPTEQNRHRLSENITQCPMSCNTDVDLPNSPLNKVGYYQNKCTDDVPFQEQQSKPYPNNAYQEPQDESLCPICNTAEDLYSSVNTDCGQLECINKSNQKPQANLSTRTSYILPQSTTNCPISCDTSKERRSTANHSQIDQSQCSNKRIQKQNDSSKNYSDEPQSVTKCSTSCSGTINPDISPNIGCGQPGFAKSNCGNEAVDQEGSRLSLNAMPNSQLGISQRTFNESKLDNLPNVCRDSKAQLGPNNVRRRTSSCQAAADPINESINTTKGTAVPSATCASTTCPGHNSAKCLCRYPPAFSQLGCTGNITGDCNCANSN